MGVCVGVVTISELLYENMDFGYPQTMESKILRE